MVINSRHSVLTILFSLFIIIFSTTAVFAEEACCLPDGMCDNLEPQDCIDQGGTPLGVGTACTVPGACCVDEGVCEQMDSLCCVENGHTFYAFASCNDVTCDSTCPYRRFEIDRLADYNTDESINVGDAVYLGSLYSTETVPNNHPIFDANGDCFVEPSDVIQLYNWYTLGWLQYEPEECTCVDPVWYGDSCLYQSPGDVDNDGDIDIADATYLTDWIYQGGQPPPVLANADPDGNCCADSNDIVYIVDHIFQGGPAPVECTCYDIEICQDTCEGQMPGDVNNDGQISMDDVFFFINWLYKGGSPPAIPANGDPDGNCCADTNDMIYVRNYVLSGGPPPVECTCLEIELCPDICDGQSPGDVNQDGEFNVGDIVTLSTYLVNGGTYPGPNADANGDCWIEWCDVRYLNAALFQGGPPPVDCTCLEPEVCDGNVADANSDGDVNVGDAVYIVNHVFKGGDGPQPYYLCNGDGNFDCELNIGDAVAIINYAYKGGPPPACCHEWIDEIDGCGLPLR